MTQTSKQQKKYSATTKLPWFSHLLWRSARKQVGLYSTCTMHPERTWSIFMADKHL